MILFRELWGEYEMNERDFSTGLVLLDFGAKWCGPCRVLEPVLAKLTNVKVVKIDIEENSELAGRYNVSAIPRLVFLKDGEIMEPNKPLVGIQKQSVLQERIDRYNA